ncbi:MAG: hypothetical protein ACYTE3_18680, partial [Planctomycetota bacterium]
MMRYFAIPIIAVATIALAGCRGNSEKSKVGQPPDSGSDASTMARSPLADWEAQSLRGALSYVEQSEDGKHRRIQPRTHLAPVDYKSRLIIIPARDHIMELAGTDREVLPSLPPDVRERLESIPDLIRAAEAYVASASQMLDEVEAARRSGQELSKDEEARLQAQIVQQGKQGERLVNLAIDVAEARARSEHPDNEEDMLEAVERMTDPLTTDAEGKDVILNVQAFGEFLAEEVRFGSERAMEDAETAEGQGTVQYRMWAWLRNQAGRVSIENYYDAGAFEGPKRPRIAFTMTPEEQRRVERGYNTAKEAAHLYRNVRDKKSSLRAELRALWKTLRSELRSLGKWPTDDVFKDVNEVLLTAIEMAESKADEGQKKKLKELKSFITGKWKEDLPTMHKAFDELEKAASSDDFISAYMAFTENLRKELELAVHYPQKIMTNMANFEVLTQVLKEMATTESKAMLDELSQKILPETRAKLTKLIKGFFAKYAVLADEVRTSLLGRPSRERLIEMADGLDASGELPPVPAIDLDDILPGTIDLNKTPADRGDELTIRAELFTTDEDGEEDLLQWAEQSFLVDRYGVTSDFSSHLVFVNRLGSGLTTDPDTDFDPAPSASWNLRKRIRPDVDEDWHAKWYRFFDPALGINTAAMDFEDENFQIGVGGHLSIFDNLLIFGYGYNLQADTDHDYFYLGIGVLEALDTVGSLFGAASGSL